MKAKYGLAELPSELHRTRAFLRVEDRVFHTYSTYGRGTEQVGGTHYYLDMTALGRQEDWEEPKGRAESLGPRADQARAGARSGRRQLRSEHVSRSRGERMRARRRWPGGRCLYPRGVLAGPNAPRYPRQHECSPAPDSTRDVLLATNEHRMLAASVLAP
jgi:Bacterial protein of unknown function (DUF899)